MRSTIRTYQAAVVLLTAALLATLTVALTGGDRADAVDGPVEVVYVATGRDFPDALAGATLATTTGAPLLTVERTLPLPAGTVAALEALDPDRIIIFGGSNAVSDDIATALAAHARSGQVTRIEGTDRHGTAAAIADALPDKVADADLLDGLDSTDFLRTTDSIDADTLDGVDSTDFLRQSDASALATTVYEPALQVSTFQETIPETAVDAESGLVVFAQSNLPSGTYLATGQIMANVTVEAGPMVTGESNVTCQVHLGDAVSDSRARIGEDPGNDEAATMPLSLAATLTSPGDARLVCWATGVVGPQPAVNIRDFTQFTVLRLGDA